MNDFNKLRELRGTLLLAANALGPHPNPSFEHRPFILGIDWSFVVLPTSRSLKDWVWREPPAATVTVQHNSGMSGIYDCIPQGV